MSKNKNVSGIVFVVIGFILGLAFAAYFGGHVPSGVEKSSKTVYVLSDEKCDICSAPFEQFVSFIENNADTSGVRIVKTSVYRGIGKEIYARLREENVNVVPLILMTKDVKGTKFFEDLNKALSQRGGIRTNIIELRNYYALRPLWPTRRYVPGKGETKVTLYADKNVNVDRLKSILYLAADNVIVTEHETNDYYILVEATPEIVKTVAQYYPLSRIADGVLEVPKMRATVLSRPDFAEAVKARLERAGIPADVNIVQYGEYVLAKIVTDYPDIVAELFPGSKYYPDGVVLTRDETATVDVYLAENAEPLLEELNRILYAADGRITVNPHYIVRFDASGKPIIPGGDTGLREMVAEYCAYLNGGPMKWTSFALSFRECGATESCIETAAEDANINVDRVKTCYSSSANQIVSFFVQDSARSGVGQTLAIINGWYVLDPRIQDIANVLCKMLSFPPKEICEGVRA